MGLVFDPKGLMNQEFRCPECGGESFGTSHARNWDKAVGHCRSYVDGQPCGYTWPRKNDDTHFVQKENKDMKDCSNCMLHSMNDECPDPKNPPCGPNGPPVFKLEGTVTGRLTKLKDEDPREGMGNDYGSMPEIQELPDGRLCPACIATVPFGAAICPSCELQLQ